jgi:hypothetical protein
MQVHIMRNRSFGHAVREIRLDRAGRDLQTTSLRAAALKQRS